MAKSRKTWRRFLKPLPLLLIALLIGLASFAIYRWQHNSGTTTQAPTNPAPHVDLNPPTQEQQNAAHDTPATTGSGQNSTNSGAKKSVKPFITSADKFSARAYVPGVVEDGGTCTATFTHGADKVTASSQAFANVSNTNCRPMTLNGPLNISGTWTVVVSYNSGISAGSSDPFTFEVQ